jgi:hypothetical protein
MKPRYDSVTGALEVMSLHSIPSAITAALGTTNGSSSSSSLPQRMQGMLTSSRSSVPGDESLSIGRFKNVPWIGFNVEDAAAHIKLDSKVRAWAKDIMEIFS